MLGIVMDIGGVLTNGLVTVVDEWAADNGVTRADVFDAVFGGNDDQILIGRTSEDDWWKLVASRLATDCAGLREAIETSGVWNDELIMAVKAAGKRCRTAILSNAWPWQRVSLESRGLLDVFDEVLLSCEIGVAKPDAGAFHAALDRLGSAPDRTLFIDDSAENVDAARSLGIDGHLHRTARESLRRIEDFVRAG